MAILGYRLHLWYHSLVPIVILTTVGIHLHEEGFHRSKRMFFPFPFDFLRYIFSIGYSRITGISIFYVVEAMLRAYLLEERVMKVNKRHFVRAQVRRKITPGEMLQTLRELQELTQKDLADQTGTSQSNLSAMENHVSQIGRDRALILAKVLKVHPAVILFPDFDIAQVA